MILHSYCIYNFNDITQLTGVPYLTMSLMILHNSLCDTVSYKDFNDITLLTEIL